jgi:hypothetical protein
MKNINELAKEAGLDLNYPTREELNNLNWIKHDGKGMPKLDYNKSIYINTRAASEMKETPMYGFVMGPVKVFNLLPVWGWTHEDRPDDVVEYALVEDAVGTH